MVTSFRAWRRSWVSRRVSGKTERRTAVLEAGVSVPKLKNRIPVVESGSEGQLATVRTPVGEARLGSFGNHAAHVPRTHRWYAAGHRVRGQSLPSGGEEQQVFLSYPRPCFCSQPADEGMAHLKPLFCVPFLGSVSYGMPDVVVVSDSTMDLPWVMYGLACLLREHGLNLLCLVPKPGAGAKELGAVWGKSPIPALSG